MKNWISGFSVFVMLGFCLAAGSAHAGIIITEGKIQKNCGDIQESQPQAKQCRVKKTKKSKGKPVVGIAKPKAPGQTGNSTGVEGDEGSTSGVGGVGDLDNPDPEGWDCVDVGGGVEVCEPTEEGQGAAPGTGPGGGLSGTTSAGEDTVMSACTGAPTTHGAMWLLCLAFLFVRRRKSLLA